MKEEWKDIKGYENKYQVSTLGRVRSLKNSKNTFRIKLLSLRKHKQGYLLVNLSKNNIIYAHARKDKTMFGTLKNTLKKDWYDNKNNHIIIS